MKFLYFNDFRLGVLIENKVIDITDQLSDIPNRDSRDLINGLIDKYDNYKDLIEDYVNNNDGVDINSVRLRSPCPRPSNIDCMAVNYMEDGTRKEAAPINAFHKATSTVIGPVSYTHLTLPTILLV